LWVVDPDSQKRLYRSLGNSNTAAFAKSGMHLGVGCCYYPLEMKQLFQDTDRREAPSQEGRAVAVAVNANVWSQYDYLWPEPFGVPAVGRRVRVPFGKSDKPTIGFVTGVSKPTGTRKLKAVAEVLGDGPAFDAKLWQLGNWVSKYYLAPLGMSLAAMIPSALDKTHPRTETVVYLVGERHDWPGNLGGRQKRVLDELYEARRQEVEPLALGELLRHSGASRDTVKRLTNRELIRLETRPIKLPEFPAHQQDDPFELNEDQLSVLSEIEQTLGGGFSCTLLHGVTGSGKTEVYIRLIRKVIQAGLQAIVLAPEIALATQTYQRLLGRLPRVAVLHSGLTDSQRAFHYQQIRDGQASVVVGPRSAVFAPARKLALVIVDEEHEPSYKQDTTPRYHGRDVAVKRASIEAIPVLLGSATPSLESLRNAQLGRYRMLRLPKRVRGLPMPSLHIVKLRQELRRGRIELIGKTLTNRIAAALDRGEQVILLMNRRGYASYVFCPKCDWRLSCDECSRLLVFHQATQLAMCHYCQRTAPVPDRCPACDGKLVFFGYGIQRIDSELARKFPSARVARMDSDTMTSPKQFRQVLEAFREGRLEVLLGTQMVAKGLDFPRVSLVGVVSADTSLAIPDFRASERTFQLVVQVAGRAGRADLPGEVIVQTIYPDEPAIRFASGHDYSGFSAHEIPLRQQAGLPPFTRMVRVIVRHRQLDRAEKGASEFSASLRELLPAESVRIVGPQPAAVMKIRGQFRFQTLLISSRTGVVQDLLFGRMADLCRKCAGQVVVDVDPIGLL